MQTGSHCKSIKSKQGEILYIPEAIEVKVNQANEGHIKSRGHTHLRPLVCYFGAVVTVWMHPQGHCESMGASTIGEGKVWMHPC